MNTLNWEEYLKKTKQMFEYMIHAEHSERFWFIIECRLKEHDTKLVEAVEGLKKYHKEFECNGAHKGKGCYESWCEDQDCRNAPKEYNKALQDAVNIIKGV